ncbi:hypothetical protein BDK62_106238 [Halomonas alkaliantarctica]|nr:hypothetical protein BDK62_106238 [Halomonas alkaliantarctica]
MYFRRSSWHKYQAVRLADKVGDRYASIRTTALLGFSAFTPKDLRQWRRDLEKSPLPPTRRRYLSDIANHEDVPELPILERNSININSIPADVKNDFSNYLAGSRLSSKKISRLNDYAIINQGGEVDEIGTAVKASWEKSLDGQCRIANIEKKIIYYPSYKFNIEFTVISLLARDNALALHIENSFIDSFLGYLTCTYFYPAGKYTTDLEMIKLLDSEYTHSANIYIKPKSLLNFRNYKLVDKIFSKELFEYRRDFLLSSSRLWNGRSTAKEAYEIISSIGFNGFKGLLSAYMANPAILNTGWPDLIVVKDNDFRFVEVKVGEKLNDNQIQNIIKLNCIFPGKVVVVQAFNDSVKANDKSSLGDMLFGAHEYVQ